MTTDNKTLAVDVLAVLRQIADGEGDAQVLAMRARVAVAEMLSALQVAELALRERGLCVCGEYKQIEAALARVKGESA